MCKLIVVTSENLKRQKICRKLCKQAGFCANVRELANTILRGEGGQCSPCGFTFVYFK